MRKRKRKKKRKPNLLSRYVRADSPRHPEGWRSESIKPKETLTVTYETWLNTLSDRELTALWVKHCAPREGDVTAKERAFALSGKASEVTGEMHTRGLLAPC